MISDYKKRRVQISSRSRRWSIPLEVIATLSECSATPCATSCGPLSPSGILQEYLTLERLRAATFVCVALWRTWGTTPRDGTQSCSSIHCVQQHFESYCLSLHYLVCSLLTGVSWRETTMSFNAWYAWTSFVRVAWCLNNNLVFRCHQNAAVGIDDKPFGIHTKFEAHFKALSPEIG